VDAHLAGPEVTGTRAGLRDVQVHTLVTGGRRGVRVVGHAADRLRRALVQALKLRDAEPVGVRDVGRAAGRRGHRVERERDVDQQAGVVLVAARPARGPSEVDATWLRRVGELRGGRGRVDGLPQRVGAFAGAVGPGHVAVDLGVDLVVERTGG